FSPRRGRTRHGAFWWALLLRLSPSATVSCATATGIADTLPLRRRERVCRGWGIPTAAPSWQRRASVADLKRNRVIWKGRAKDASAYILPKGQCPPAESTLEVRA